MNSPMEEADFVRSLSRRSGVGGHVATSAMLLMAMAAISCDDLGMRVFQDSRPSGPEPHTYTEDEGRTIARQIAARRKAKRRKR